MINLRLLDDDESDLKTCASASLWALLTAVGLAVATIGGMIVRSAYGVDRTPVTDATVIAVSITCGSLLQLASKGKGWHHTRNRRPECDVAENNGSLLAFAIGESGTFLAAAVQVSHRRVQPLAHSARDGTSPHDVGRSYTGDGNHRSG